MAMNVKQKQALVDGLPAYRSILLAVDSSDHANCAIGMATNIAGQWGACLTATHVYGAKMHDLRFRQMEGGLPEKYREEQELEHQREVHDDLITQGLSLIGDSYLDQVDTLCRQLQVQLVRRNLEGKNYRALVEEVNSGSYDLLVMGALGLGALPGNRLGTVCSRVARRSDIDVLVIKRTDGSLQDGPIVVAVDGSSRSYGGLLTALALAEQLNLPVKIVAAFDPYYHYVAFNRIAGVLSEEAGKVFRFKEQEQLHEEIIDAGIARIYQGHLDIAESIAADYGIPVETELLAGKPHDAIEKYLSKIHPALLVIGKLGIHADPDLDIGGNAENLLRNVDCNVLLSQREFTPRTDVVAQATTSWTRQAEERLAGVPPYAVDMVRLGILRYAQERGHTVITEKIVDEATRKLCPVHVDHAASAGDEAAEPAISQGGREKFKPDWSSKAEELADSITDESLRRNVMLRAEKKARQAGTDVLPEYIQEFVGSNSEAPGKPQGKCPFGFISEPGLSDVATLPWSADAQQWLQRVPEGFMRKLTLQRVETYARKNGFPGVTLEVMQAKYAQWGAGSKQQEMTMEWDGPCAARLEKIPDFVRGMVMKEIERCSRALGFDRVTAEAMRKASSAWEEKQLFHSESKSNLYE